MSAPMYVKRFPRLGSAAGIRFALALLAVATWSQPVFGQFGDVETIGGTGEAGYVEGGKGGSEFSSPQGVAFRDGLLFIADSGNNAVRVMRVDTTLTRLFAVGSRPVGVVFDRATNLFVANQGNSTITKFDFFGNQRGFPVPAFPGGELTALAIDRNDNLYVAQRRGIISRVTPAGFIDAQYGSVRNDREFRGVAVLDDGTVLVSDAVSHVIWKFTGPSPDPVLFAGTLGSAGETNGEIGFGRFNRPHQIAAGPNGTVVVADRGNHRVRVVSCTGVVSPLYGIDPDRWFIVDGEGIFPGWWDSSAEFAELRDPVGVTVSPAGIVYDTEDYYHLVRRGTGLAFPACPTTGGGGGGGGGGGSATNAPVPVLSPSSGFFPDGVTITITASNLTAFPRDTKIYYTLDGTTPDSSDPQVPIAADGRAFLTLPGPVDLGGLRVVTVLGALSSPVVSAQPTQVPRLLISPSSGYYPMGVDVLVQSTNDFPSGTLLYYTTNGEDPTTNSIPLLYSGNTAVIKWRDAQNDLRSLRVRAFLGPNVGPITSGQAVSFPSEPQFQGSVGIPAGRAQFNAGIGSFYILPVVANLRNQQTLRSLQFVVELTAGAGAPRLERTDVQVLPMSTNDFIQIRLGAISLPDSTISNARDGVNRLAIAYFGTNSGFNVSGHAVVAMLGIQFRTQDSLGNRADVGDEYTIRVTQISGTSDGIQNLIDLKPLESRTIRLQNISFLEGDTSPAYWYNAGDFGNDILENGDVNNAVFAAFGFRKPYAGSDAFAAMDVYRVGVLENVIEFNDAATILRRALGFEPANIRRSRDANGQWVQVATGFAALSTRQSLRAFAATSTDGLAWQRDVLIRAGTVQRVQANQSVSVPIYMKADSGLTVSGMQFVGDVVPSAGAPGVQGVSFVPASNIPGPRMNGSTVPGLGTLPATVYTRWDNLEPGLSGELLLGYIQFSTPASATPEQSYAIVLHNTGGATIDPDTGVLQGFLFEGQRGYVLLNSAQVVESREASDDWKENFFGSAVAAQAMGALDADGDGLTNFQEYLVGTNPNAGDWSARVSNGQFTMRWVGEAGRKYTIESTENFQNWNAAADQFTGQDAFLEYKESRPGTRARFYRLKVQ